MGCGSNLGDLVFQYRQHFRRPWPKEFYIVVDDCKVLPGCDCNSHVMSLAESHVLAGTQDIYLNAKIIK
jgi:hypothetical protein